MKGQQVAEARSNDWRDFSDISKRAFLSFLRNDSGNLSAAIAFYSLLSLFPLVMLIVSVSGFFIQHFNLSRAIIHQASSLVPAGRELIRENLVTIVKHFGRVQLVSILLLWWSASGVFNPLERAMNRAWRVSQGRNYWRRHLLALGMVLICGTLLLCSLLVTTVQRQVWHLPIMDQLRERAPLLFSLGWRSLFWSIPVFFTIITFLLIYRIVPNRQLQFRQVAEGALAGSILWEIAKDIFAALLPYFNYRHVYGSLAAGVAIMMWGYISSLILLFGAEFAAAVSATTITPPNTASSPDPSSSRALEAVSHQ